MKKNLQIEIAGDVQGVGFRYQAMKYARSLGLTGWAANTSHGHVHIEAEGETVQLAVLLDWCHIGPPGARVKKVGFEYSDHLKNYQEFKVEIGKIDKTI